MIYTTLILQSKYPEVSNLLQKASIEAKKGRLTRIKRGIYTDNLENDRMTLSNFCYGPSYISFEYALAFYDLIPEQVSTLTSATFKKRRGKIYQFPGGRFEYRDIPPEAFPHGILTMTGPSGLPFRIASKEKALLDELYSKQPLSSFKSLATLLFIDLRIDEGDFWRLDVKALMTMAPLYHSTTLDVLVRYLRKGNSK